jgi:ankyrin repeat protein
LEWSLLRGSDNLIRLLLGYVPRFGEGTASEYRIFDRIVVTRTVELLNLVLDRHGIDANTILAPPTINEPTTLLGLAVQFSRAEMIHCLLERCAKLKPKSEVAMQALRITAREGHQELFQLLVKRGVDINKKFNHMSPIHIACQAGR